LFSPVPTQTTLGFFGSMVTQPVEYELSWSKTGSQVVPALVVRHTPPEATVTKRREVSVGSTAMSETRPDEIAGPISRNSRPDRVSSVSQ
jgi:hypothetical protein